MYVKVVVTAEDNGWDLNPNGKYVDFLVTGLEGNKNRHGEPYCPCSISREKSMICPCGTAAEDIEKDGQCNCRLFYKRGASCHGY